VGLVVPYRVSKRAMGDDVNVTNQLAEPALEQLAVELV
jgi:hypothetical protein